MKKKKRKKSPHQYKHLLLATDLSSQSNLVAKQAAHLAKLMRAKLSVVHVAEHAMVAYGGEYSLPIAVDLDTALKQKAKKELARLGKKYHIPEKQQYVKEGSVKHTVIDLAKKISADLIVVGTHGHHGINLLLGSQANAILHAAQCDVWVVHMNNENRE